MIITSLICAVINGRVDALASALLSGADDAIKIIVSTLGAMILWSGIMQIAQDSGLIEKLSNIFSPIFKFLFPEYIDHKKVLHPICLNIVSNLLGLGNAATPYGILAMKEMQKLNSSKHRATNGMIMFLILNIACLQLIPTFLIVLRKTYGAENPFDILPIIWISSLCALITGVSLVKFMQTSETNNELKHSKFKRFNRSFSKSLSNIS
jgi:spore maturation protein A